MLDDRFERAVFVNCPFDDDYAPLLEAALFCIVSFGFSPRLANERLEAGENRLDKIIEMIRESKYSIHDLSRCKAKEAAVQTAIILRLDANQGAFLTELRSIHKHIRMNSRVEKLENAQA